MTLIVDPKNFTSKAKLQESLNAGNCVVHEPSIMGEWTKLAKDLPVGFSGVVTNHPLRTKFAEIKRTANGWQVR